MSKSITLYDIVSHQDFGEEGWRRRKKQAELKLIFGNIVEKLVGIHPQRDKEGGFKKMFSFYKLF